MRTLTPILILLLVLHSACRKEKNEAPAMDHTSAVDMSSAEQYFNDMLQQADDAAKDNGLRDTDDPCAPVITFDTVAMPHILLIDLGNVNCTALNGLQRRGRILVTFTGPYRAPGTVVTLTPQDYHVNDHHVQGTKTVTNLGLNDDDQTFFSVAVNGSVTAPDGSWTSTHTAQRIRTWVQGEYTPNPFDDIHHITGSGSGVNRTGRAYTVTITQALRVAIGCPWITAGNVEVAPQDLPTRYVDFGSGSCDGQVSVTVNGTTFTFGTP